MILFQLLLKTVIISFIIVSVLFLLSLMFVYSNTHPPRYPLHVSPSEFGLDYEEVTINPEKSLSLKGWFVKAQGSGATTGEKRPAIVISHGLGASKSDFTDFSAELSRRGYHVLLYDFRGHGESQGRRTSLGYLEQKDLLAAVDYVKQREDVQEDGVGLYGFSLGAAVSIMTAARHKNVRAVVSDSSYTSLKEEGVHVLQSFYRLPSFPFETLMTWAYRLFFFTDVDDVSPLKEIAGLSPIPVFLIGGERDRMMPASFAERLFEKAGDPKSLWIISDARHGETLFRAGEEYTRRVSDFFALYLKEKVE